MYSVYLLYTQEKINFKEIHKVYLYTQKLSSLWVDIMKFTILRIPPLQVLLAKFGIDYEKKLLKGDMKNGTGSLQ